jgi:hypothetical protein
LIIISVSLSGTVAAAAPTSGFQFHAYDFTPNPNAPASSFQFKLSTADFQLKDVCFA